jgi:hypothetical protein
LLTVSKRASAKEDAAVRLRRATERRAFFIRERLIGFIIVIISISSGHATPGPRPCGNY